MITIKLFISLRNIRVPAQSLPQKDALKGGVIVNRNRITTQAYHSLECSMWGLTTMRKDSNYKLYICRLNIVGETLSSILYWLGRNEMYRGNRCVRFPNSSHLSGVQLDDTVSCSWCSFVWGCVRRPMFTSQVVPGRAHPSPFWAMLSLSMGERVELGGFEGPFLL